METFVIGDQNLVSKLKIGDTVEFEIDRTGCRNLEFDLAVNVTMIK